MRQLLVLLGTGALLAGCMADYGEGGLGEIEGRSSASRDRSAAGADSNGGSKSKRGASDEAGDPELVDPPALADGAVETVPVRCKNTSGIQGNGEITRTSRRADGFVDVVMELSGRLEIHEGSTFRVHVETDANVQDAIVIRTDDDALVIGGQGSFCTHRLRVVVTMPRFHGVELAGAGEVVVDKRSGASDVVLDHHGTGSLTFRGQASALDVTLRGAGAVVLASGAATSTTIDLSGAGEVVGKDFEPGRLTKNVTGTGRIEL